MRVLFLCMVVFTLTGCSVFGKNNTEIAPYKVLEKEDHFELRHYDRLILVTTAMPDGMESQNSPFYKLFDYISGDNGSSKEIPMTSPVFMEQENQGAESMSFVLPKDFTIQDAPEPQDPTVRLEQITDYTVATIRFNGLLRQGNIEKHKDLLNAWIAEKGFEKTGPVKAAGYNPPFTLPAFRRNEILIPVQKP